MKSLLLGAGIVSLVLAQAAPASNMQKWVGKWTLNPSKSKFDEGPRPADGIASLRQTMKINLEDGNLDLYIHLETADGTDVADESHLLDLSGKEHRTTVDGVGPTTETFKRVDNNSFDFTIKIQSSEFPDVEILNNNHFVLALDGKTITETRAYTYKQNGAPLQPEGDGPKPNTSILIFDKSQLP